MNRIGYTTVAALVACSLYYESRHDPRGAQPHIDVAYDWPAPPVTMTAAATASGMTTSWSG